MLIVCNLPQPPNAYSLIDVIDVGSETDERSLQFWKALAPMDVTLLESVIEVKPVLLKAQLPIVVTVLGMLMDSKMVHPANK